VRLSYLGTAQRGPDAVWLCRLPDKLPVLLPSLAGNVTEAWMLVKFALNSERGLLSSHTVLVSAQRFLGSNGSMKTVPDGRYLLARRSVASFQLIWTALGGTAVPMR